MTATWNAVGVAATVGIGVVGGVFSTFSTFVGSALRSLPAPDAVAAMQAVNVAAVRPPLMVALFGSAVLGVAAAVHAVRVGDGPAWPTVTGAALYVVGTLGTTVVWNVPRNDRLASWTASTVSPAQWTAWFASWEAGNHVRTATSLAAAALLALGTARGWRVRG